MVTCLSTIRLIDPILYTILSCQDSNILSPGGSKEYQTHFNVANWAFLLVNNTYAILPFSSLTMMIVIRVRRRSLQLLSVIAALFVETLLLLSWWGSNLPDVHAFVVPNRILSTKQQQPQQQDKTRPFHYWTTRLWSEEPIQPGAAASSSSSSSSSVPSSMDKNLPSLEDVMASYPNPHYTAIDVVTICMQSLHACSVPSDALSVCFVFSSDQCRAAVGGTLTEFIKYANNPIFGSLVQCEQYKIVSIGPIISPSQHRGEMQTVLIEITKSRTKTMGSTIPTPAAATAAAVSQQQQPRQQRRPTIEERMRAREQRHVAAQGGRPQDVDGVVVDDDGANDSNNKDDNSNNNKRIFLWTLQRERRPPRQDCWLVHEVLDKKNAFLQTF